MWTRINEDDYWNAYNPTTYESSAITPAPNLEQYLLWITNTPSDPINGIQQVNSAPVLGSLQAELGVQIAAGGGTASSGGGQVESVPGPLPVLGLVAAFGWARRLRRVVRAARK